MFTNERLFTIQAFTITRVHCISTSGKVKMMIKNIASKSKYIIGFSFDLILKDKKACSIGLV